MDIFNFVKSEFKKYAEPAYCKFSSALIPNINNVLGIRIPILRKIAKQIAKNDWQKFLDEHEEKFMEDTMLKGLIITYLNKDIDLMFKLVEDFVPKINNWAVCDTFCTGLKFFKKDKVRAFKFLSPYLISKDEFLIRFAVVVLLAHFIEDDYIDKVLEILFNLKLPCINNTQNSEREYYYADMAIAWAISVCYVKYPKKTFEYLKSSSLNDFCHNKSISKIIESYRVPKEDKDKLRLLKRKTKASV